MEWVPLLACPAVRLYQPDGPYLRQVEPPADRAALDKLYTIRVRMHPALAACPPLRGPETIFRESVIHGD